MTKELMIAVLLLIFLMFFPAIQEAYYDGAAEEFYKAQVMALFKKYAKGKTFTDDTLLDPVIGPKFVNDFILVFNQYAEKTKTPKLTVDNAASKFPEAWVAEYNASIQQKN